jgi:hypothetical protein
MGERVYDWKKLQFVTLVQFVFFLSKNTTRLIDKLHLKLILF